MKKKDKNREVKRYSYTLKQLIVGGILLAIASIALFSTVVILMPPIDDYEDDNITYVEIDDPDNVFDGTYSIDEEYILQEVLPEMPSIFDYERVIFSLSNIGKESVSVIFTVTDESFGRFISENLEYITSTADEDEIKWHFTSTMHKSHSLLKEKADIDLNKVYIYTESSNTPIITSHGIAVEMPILDNTRW